MSAGSGLPPDPTAALVLVVDDDGPSRDLVVEILQDAGYGVRGADSVAAAHAALEEIVPRAIVLDLRMPKVDGVAFCRWVRARADAIATVPILFLSASDSLREQLEALRAGGNDFLVKPVDETLLLAKLRSALSMAQLVRQATTVQMRAGVPGESRPAPSRPATTAPRRPRS